ncbi:DUF1043 family protein [Alteromonas pelagimontana]|uniref:DUF1043 family protein n=1 Tax=Alteromonas pelagimontana TaxID=1858656 RepID=A0A6M4MBP8_9ALTE|nr:DUF1043 family protein [Alteromonas pelagimontana]QJR80228.1 DUF1043 family protein [Alteromonas pelagimontana]
MDVLIPLALLVVGLIIGFFVARYQYTRDGVAGKANKTAEQNIKEIMAQQAEHHVHQTRQTIESIEKQCQSLKQQVDEYETLLVQNTDEDAPRVPFYGEQASTYLRNNLKGKEKVQIQSVSATQPKDFANTGSGLFVGSAGQSTAEKDR